MNHLAHVVLAGANPLAITGAVLGDFWRGALDPDWPDALAAGVGLHRAIDSHTDRHPAVLGAKQLFEPGFRRYVGIALDVWFDHLLARDCEHLTGVPLAQVCAQAYQALKQAPPGLPPPFQIFVARLIANDGLGRSVDLEAIDATLGRISARLSRPNPLAHALPMLEALDQPLRRVFARLWPDLQALAEPLRP